MCRRVSACEIFLNFSVRIPKNHIFCDRSIERTVQISLAQSQKLSLKKAKLSLKNGGRWPSSGHQRKFIRNNHVDKPKQNMYGVQYFKNTFV